MRKEQEEKEKERAEQKREDDLQRAAEEASQGKQEQEEVDSPMEEQRGEEPQATPSNVASLEANDESQFLSFQAPVNDIPDNAFGVGGPSFDFSGYDGPPEELEEWMVRVAMRMSLAQQQ